jgi:protein gp37
MLAYKGDLRKMSDGSHIEWTDATWNPVRGCTKVSPGCKFCYAQVFAERFRGVPGHPFEQGFDLRLVPKSLDLPLRWRKSKLIFVNSMSDLFHEDVSDEYVAKVMDTIKAAPQHQFQILTKRAERMASFSRKFPVPRNAWLGVSVESKKYVSRIDHLRTVQASVRFLSIEPLLESLGELDLSRIHWAIVGGESGPRSREMKPEWVDEIEAMCARSGTVFFFKQWGGRNKKAAGRLLHGRTYDDMPLGI